MYNIKQAAARAGVSVPVLRAWERRYGIVEPARTASGYRQFDDPAVDRIRAMRELVDAGWAPSSAAAAILDGSAPVGTSSSASPLASQSQAAGAESPLSATFTERFVTAAQALDPAAVEDVLDDTFAGGSFERVAGDVLFPMLRGLGDAWAAGIVSVAGEHLASAAVLRRLGLAFDAAARANRESERVIVGLPPGGRHELGALAFAVAARRAGLAVTYLGGDLPVEDWVAAASGAAAAVIGVVTARDRRPALDVARAIRAVRPEIVVAFGGDGAPDEPDVIHLDSGLTRAVAELSAALGLARA